MTEITKAAAASACEALPGPCRSR